MPAASRQGAGTPADAAPERKSPHNDIAAKRPHDKVGACQLTRDQVRERPPPDSRTSRPYLAPKEEPTGSPEPEDSPVTG